MSTCDIGCADDARLRVLVDGIQDHGIYMLDPTGAVVTWNAGAQRLKGYAADEVLGRNFELFYTAEDRALGHPVWVLSECAASGRYEEDGWRVRKDGTRFWANIVLTALRDSSGTIVGFGKVTRDMTERMSAAEEKADLVSRLAVAEAEQKRAELEAALHQAQRMDTVGQLAGGIAHDFNNLLAAIMSYASLLSRSLDAERADRGPDERIDEMICDAGEITSVATKAASLTRQLLIFSRRDVVTVETQDVNSIVADVEKLLRRTLGEAIQLSVDLADGRVAVEADRSQLEQVIMNLAVNARGAMPEGGALSISTHAVADPTGDNALVELVVQDTGCGMPPEVLQRVLEPYFTTKPRGEGTGLGLSIVHGIVTQAGGQLAIQSEVGRGTRIAITLPASTKQVGRAAAGVDPVGPSRGETILLAEDERAVREPLRRLLTRSGYVVLAAQNATEALGLYEELDGPIDLLLTDVVMPGGSGRDLARKIIDQDGETKVLYMTGYGEDVITHRGVLDTDIDVITKPFTAPALLARVHDVLQSPVRTRVPGIPSNEEQR